nr:MAG TPA: hypothetical protein [Caudoviricetes sp.]
MIYSLIIFKILDCFTFNCSRAFLVLQPDNPSLLRAYFVLIE